MERRWEPGHKKETDPSTEHDDREESSAAGATIVEDRDGRNVGDAASRYSLEHRVKQKHEAWYLFGLITLSTALLAGYPLGLLSYVVNLVGGGEREVSGSIGAFFVVCSAGLLGGTVYGGKWLYHAVAKGIWSEDRAIWRFLSPWISLGTTLGVSSLFFAGLFKAGGSAPSTFSGHSLVGIGFLIGYFSDMALAKMKDVTEVLFGETRTR